MSDSCHQAVDYNQVLKTLPCFNNRAKPSAIIRQNNSDFKVVESLVFEPCGDGEHLYLFVEKDGCNTDWVARQLQRAFSVKPVDIGYAGKKDRHSVSRQWFSVHLPGRSVDLSEIDNPDFKILKSCRHNKKLRLGSVKNNRFELIVNQLGDEIDNESFAEIAETGVPNYFGYQRFGFHGNNLLSVAKMFEGRIKVKSKNKKGLYLSSARSWLFNLILAQRLHDKTWHLPQPGDCLMLDGSHSFFECDTVDEEIHQRHSDKDIHICGWLPGKQISTAMGYAKQVEDKVIQQNELFYRGIFAAGASSSRRALRVVPQDLTFEYLAKDRVKFGFSLPSGSFATSVLRELIDFEDAALRKESID